MSSHPPNVHTPNLARDEQRREEARKEEMDRKMLEDTLYTFPSHEFYEALQKWAELPVPPPVIRNHEISWSKKPVLFQPIPVPRSEYHQLIELSNQSARLVTLLKASEQKGYGCPYIHRQMVKELALAIEKCKEIQKAIQRFHLSNGMVAKLLFLLQRRYIFVLAREVELFLNRLEAIYLICRHEEFAQDLMRLRRAVTYRTGYVLGPEVPSAAPSQRKMKR